MTTTTINDILKSAVIIGANNRCQAIVYNSSKRILSAWFRKPDKNGIEYLKDYFNAFMITFVAL